MACASVWYIQIKISSIYTDTAHLYQVVSIENQVNITSVAEVNIAVVPLILVDQLVVAIVAFSLGLSITAELVKGMVQAVAILTVSQALPLSKIIPSIQFLPITQALLL